MADSSALALALAQLSKGYADTNMYSKFGAAFNSAPDYVNPYQSPWASFGVNFVKGLLGGGLDAYGAVKNREFAMNSAKLLPQLVSGGDATVPEGMSDTDIGLVRGMADSVLGQRALDREDAVQKILDARLMSRAEEQGKLEGVMAAAGDGAKAEEIPDTPQYKAKQDKIKNDLEKNKFIIDLEKDTQELITNKDPSAVAAGQMFPAFKALQELIPVERGPQADLTFKASIARILDPVGAVGKDSTDLAQKAQPLWDQFLGNYGGLLGSDGYFTPESRAKVVESLSSRVAPIAEQYQKLVDNQMEVLESRGGSRKTLNPIPYTPYTKQSDSPGGLDPAAIAAEYAALKATKGDAGARAAILTKYGAGKVAAPSSDQKSLSQLLSGE